MNKRQNVTMKGTKDGITLHLDDACSYEELKKELNHKLIESSKSQEDKLISVLVHTGNRYLTSSQEEEIKELIRQKKNLVVESVLSNVLTKDEAEKQKQANEIVSITKIVRSGQVIEVPGDLLLIGDVNPGGTVRAGGNIFIMGELKGIAHAGYYGNQEAVISASIMRPTQLRICDSITRAPDEKQDENSREMECAYMNEEQQIIIDRLQVLVHVRPNISNLQGGF
ncbi:septum site-determining protein MinC [Cytobacillus sp. FSL W7-1323]|uniref:Probable septum site-determining protein MinC n=1 Tax=Cytobacillus kochii TaxID=859143 RepID=A0A248TKW0_9BACI|nr:MULTISPECIES: septum site-determining protein MinC [Cytobacillus]ASV68837.1 septum site-determining protein MinC [Cytobacillus kochii]MDQ0183549.1 septum site-determining protein MinC [Cytobacillus kochii]MEA1853275.1 septum site-determining protein MinC [Cytobacillus sp. OWB-43]MED1603873.1 septum site-determining protein MinC [Cytobacillus kochii]